MKRKELKELKNKTIRDLEKMVVAKRLEAEKSRVGIVSGKEKNIKSYFLLRKVIAKILTFIREKKIAEKFEAKTEK